jgi:hypothetical protein
MSASRQISVRLAIEGAEEARRKLEELRKQGEATGEGMQPTPQQIAAWERLNRAVDPNIAAATRYEQVVRRVQAAEAAGVGTTEQRNRVLEQAAVAHQRATVSMEQQTQSSGRFGQAMGQAGFQVQDFATQVAMGQNALLAFGVQFAQFAGIFGTAGAIAGAAVTVGVLGAQFLGAGAAADTLGDAVKAVNDNYTRLNDSAERRQAAMASEASAVASLAAEYTAMGLAAARAESLIVERRGAALDLEGGRMRDALTGSLSESVRQRMNPRDAFDPLTGQALGLARPEEGLAALSDALGRVQTDAGRSMQAMREVAAEADRLAQSGQSGASSFARLRDAALDMLPAAAQLDTAQRQLAIQTLAAAEAAGAGESAIRRYAERFGELGAEIRQAATALNTLRRINSESPFADLDQEVARTEAQLTALRRGGLEALEATQQRQAVERAGAEANARVFAQELQALRERGVAQEAAEAQAAAAAQAAQERAQQGVLAAQALTREQRAAEQAAREAAQAAAQAAREAARAGAAGARGMVRADNQAAAQERRDWDAAEREHERGEARLRAVADRANDARERDAEQSAQNISRYLADGFADAFIDGERGFEGMLDSLKRLAIAAPIRIGVEALVTPIAQSAISGITGAAGAAGGAGGIAEALGFAQAGRTIMGLMPGGGAAGGGITGFLNTPIGASMGSTATIGSAFGGIGGGFALGSIIGGFTAGDSRARQQNSQIGAGAGATAGAIIGSFLPIPGGTVIGGMIGGALGGGGGGLIGPGRAFSGGDALIGMNDNGGLNVVGYAGKNFEESAALLAQAQQEVAALNATLAAAGLRFANRPGGTGEGAFATAIGGGESGNARDLLSALNQDGITGFRASDPRVQQALDRVFAAGGGSVETQIGAAQEAAAFAAQIDAMAQAAKDAEDPIGAIRRSYEEQFRIAERLGFGYDVLAAQQQKAIDATQKQIDAEKESTRQREEAAKQREEEARRAEQAARDREQAARRATAGGLIDDLTFGSLSGNLPGASRATAARLRLAGARSALSDGATQDELDELRRVAGATLPVIQQVEGITESLAALQRGIANDLRAAVPGSDAANLAGVIGATTSIGDQITSAVEAYGGAQVQEVRALREEVARLASLMAAQQARAAA